MDIILHFILGFFATLGFAIFFNVPKKSIIATCFTGAISWALSFYMTTYWDHNVFGTFLASLLVGILGEYFAVKLKKPATVFIIPGITPMVPGAGTYYTMLYLVQKNFVKALTSGAETLSIAAAIAIGIIFATVFVQYFKSIKNGIQSN